MTEATTENKPLPFTLAALLLVVVLAALAWLGVATVRELVSAGVQALMGGAMTLSLKAVTK